MFNENDSENILRKILAAQNMFNENDSENILRKILAAQDEILAELRKLNSVQNSDVSPKRNPTGKIILSVMTPGEEMSHFEIFKATRKKIEVTENEVSQALGGLTRNNQITRIHKGRYRLEISAGE